MSSKQFDGRDFEIEQLAQSFSILTPELRQALLDLITDVAQCQVYQAHNEQSKEQELS